MIGHLVDHNLKYVLSLHAHTVVNSAPSEDVDFSLDAVCPLGAQRKRLVDEQ